MGLLPLTGVAQDEGGVTAQTDVELIGVTDYSGGGHLTYTLTGQTARDFRRHLVTVFDERQTVQRDFNTSLRPTVSNGNNDGSIGAQEITAYINDLTDKLNLKNFVYGRFRNPGASDPTPAETTSGLVGSSGTSLDPAVIRLTYDFETRQPDRTYSLADPSLARYLFSVFDLRVTDEFDGSADPFDVTLGDWHASGGVLLHTYGATSDYSDATPYSAAKRTVDLRVARTANITFSYTGSAAAGDSLRFERLNGATWTALTSTAGTVQFENTAPGVYRQATYDLTPFVGQQITLALNFTPLNDSNVGPGFSIDSVSVVALATYDGAAETRHADYVVGTLSFSDFDLAAGNAHLIRTPAGEILLYGFTYDADNPPRDRVRFVAFDALENPQLLFIVVLASIIVLSNLQSRFYYYFRQHFPVRMRGKAEKIKWLHWAGLGVVLFLVLIYFFPSMFVFLGARFYFTGLIVWIVAPACAAGLSLMTKFLYDRRAKQIPIPPEMLAEAAAPGAIGASDLAALPPPPGYMPPRAHAILACAGCGNEVTDVAKAIRCKCGQILHPTCAESAVNCPNCGTPLPVERAAARKMVTIKCPTCSEIVLIEEGADLLKTKCEVCGTILKEVERGYNYLIVGDEATTAYEEFLSLVKKKIPCVALSTTFPDKIKKQYSLEGAEVWWLSDTAAPDQKALDPKRLEFEIMRVISNFAKAHRGGSIMLDGLEYLIVENGFDKVLRFVKKINDLSSVNEMTLFVPMGPKSLSSDELALLMSEFDRVEGAGGESSART